MLVPSLSAASSAPHLPGPARSLPSRDTIPSLAPTSTRSSKTAAPATCGVAFRGAAVAAGTIVAGRRVSRRRRQRVARGPLSNDDVWDSEGLGEEDELLTGTSLAEATKGKVNNFADGADFAAAKLFAATRGFAVAPWSEDVKAKPIFAVSDGTGTVAGQLAEAAFAQFGSSERAQVEVYPGIRNEEDVRGVVAKAASAAPPESLMIEKAGAMLLYTLASPDLGQLLESEARKKGVPCINALEPVLLAMEKCFGLERSLYFSAGEELLDGFEEEDRTVFAVSDSSGNSTFTMVSAALQQFPNSGVQGVTVCAEVRSLEEVNHIVEEANAVGSVVIFSFASGGMSRFMRQQCTRAKVPYADVYQPVLVAFEKYLDYPPVGVPGGHDLNSGEAWHERWKKMPLLR